MIKELSLKILDRLNLAGLQTKQIDFKGIIDRQIGALDRPAVNISINQSSFTKVTLNKYKAALVVSLFLLIQNVSGEKQRRFAIYDLIEAIIRTLILQDFGLDLQDKLRPTSFNNVTDKQFSDAGYSIYQIDFYTTFIFTRELSEDESDVGILRTIVSDYFLQDPTDDGVSDGQTIVTVANISGGNAFSSAVESIYGGRAKSSFRLPNIYGGKANSTYA